MIKEICTPRLVNIFKHQYFFFISKTFSSSTMRKSFAKQNFDYFLVLDYEATCQEGAKLSPQEIIEFPVLKINATTFATEATFHQYVQPRVHPELTSFCTKLTGIVQEMVDGQPHLEETLTKLDQWMQAEGLLQPDVKSVFVTCGDWDLKTMLPSQCKYFNIDYQAYLKKWINIKQVFEDVTGIKPNRDGDLLHMLQVLGVPHQGHYHSGIDDCTNIANILTAIAQRGVIFQTTGQTN